MDLFHRLTEGCFMIADLKGKVLVKAGCQDICARFHKTHPHTRAHCFEKDCFLTRNVKEGKCLAYRCKNNLWDVITPLMVSGKHVGNFFLGHFLYEDEAPDIVWFEQQAERFGFNKEDYIAALMRVPRWSKEKVRNIVEFYVKMLSMFTHLGYFNLQCASEIKEIKRNGEFLEESLKKFQNLAEAINDTVWEVDREWVYTYVSPRIRDLLGYEPKEMIGRQPFNLMPRLGGKRAREFFTELVNQREAFSGFEHTVFHKNGHLVVVETSGRPFFDKDNNLLGFRGVDRDVTSRKDAEEKLKKREATLDSILKASPIGIGLIENRIFRWTNDFFLKMFGYSAEEIKGNSSRMLYENDEEFDRVRRLQYQDIAQKGFGEIETRVKRKDGEVIDVYLSSVPLDLSDHSGALCFTVMDITERKDYDRELEHKATHDTLTGLANRRLLEDRIWQSMAYAARSNKNIAILLLDLDRFKRVNDILGHGTGDLLLDEVAKRLTASVRKYDTVARFGGDEFSIVLAEILDLDDVGLITQKILDNLSYPMEINGHHLEIQGSIGISVFPQDGSDPETLIKRADLAMYQAKKEGGDTFRYFSPEMTVKAQEMFSLESELREAFKKGEFLLYYQPKADIQSGRVLGCEALLRWQHPQKGVLTPDHFIAVAEESGLIFPLSGWVLEEACRQSKIWENLGIPPIQISINISARQFRQASFVKKIQDVFKKTAADPRRFSLELTESMVLQDIPGAIRIMGQLKDMGLTLQLDDFGTGFSNFSNLREFKLGYLKIDRSFISNAPKDPSAAVVVQCILAIAHKLGITSVAEGVETPEHLQFLAENGCREFQGHLFSRALPPDEFLKFLSAEMKELH
ncbi:MAG: EAL domain-containing protein [Desulfuromonadaceae bacterium]|nr:EAL domain-containing protein [Desulfuromonadaceae bacterium]